MRYSKLILFLWIAAGLMAALALTGCETSGYGSKDWQYKDVQAQPAQSAPRDIASGGVAGQQASPHQMPGEYGQHQQGQGLYGQQGTYAPDHTAFPQQRGLFGKKGTGLTKVGILLPLSGAQEKLGQAMLKTAQMAMFDVGLQNFELKPYDTKGTGDGARAAAKSAVNDEVQLILGPVFSNSVRAAKNVVRYHNVNMISFSTDWSVTSSNVFIMGFLPFDQIERIVRYAAQQGLKRIATIAPQTTYGRAIMSAYQTYAQHYGIETVDILTFNPQDPQFKGNLRSFSKYEERSEAAKALAETVNSPAMPGKGAAPKTKAEKRKLQREIERIKTEMEAPYDAVLIAAGGQTAVTISNMLARYDLPPRKVKRLGIGLFDDPTLANEFALRGSWFSAPPIGSRKAFDERYKSLYGQTPPRLASLAYDATALAAILAKNGLERRGAPNFNRRAITNPNGFAGIDGIFRFLDNGTVERGLAVLSFGKDNIKEVDAASQTFQY